MPKVSVIIAVYGAEKYIERCARSLFEQTLNDIEYIFVDDCSPDKSIEILISVLDDYPHRKKQVRIIRNHSNLGVGGTRTVGMKAATGDYLIHCDPDDWVEHNMYELLYNKAIEDKSDIVICDFFHEFPNQKIIEHFEPITPPILCINLSIKTKYWWSLWNRLVSRFVVDKYKVFPIPDLKYLEDVNLSVRLYCFANTISYISVPLYHYIRENENSILNSTPSREKYHQRRKCIDSLDTFFQNNQLQAKLAPFIYAQKSKTLQLLLDSNPIDYKELQHCYPEIGKVILNDTSRKFFYRYSIWLAQKGFTLPFRTYIFISNFLKHLTK